MPAAARDEIIPARLTLVLRPRSGCSESAARSPRIPTFAFSRRATQMRIGYIGLGNLGAHLAGSLVRAGFDVTVFDLDRDAPQVC